MTLGALHKPTGTQLRVLSSNAKTALGLVGVPVVIADEPGAWKVSGGQRMWEALSTSQGKPDSAMRILLTGTLAPAHAGWWPDLVAAGSARGVHVTALQGDRETWDAWSTIRRANPLMARYSASRAVLLDERDKARRDDRLRAAFLSYRVTAQYVSDCVWVDSMLGT